MENIVVGHMMQGEEPLIEALVKEIFDVYIAPDYAQEGIDYFYNYINENSITERSHDSKYRMHTAKIDRQIVGILETRDNSHICLFFVNKAFHRRGIGKSLFEYAFRESKGDLTVNASPYGAPIYEKLGFSKINGEMIRNGITYIPMIKSGKN
jgi:GNAT superfamily N-acetyltransferase